MRWLPSQIVAVIMDYAHNGIAFCPVDYTPLIVDTHPLPGSRQTVTVHRCPTCGNDTSSALPTTSPYPVVA